MGVLVDYTFYAVEYRGQEVDEASFPTLCAHASRIIGNMTRWQVTEETIETFPSLVRILYRLAICSQIDFLAINGLESVSSSGGVGFSVGKVRVDGKAGTTTGGAMSASVSPAAVAYLEQTGLMNPQVPAVEGWW